MHKHEPTVTLGLSEFERLKKLEQMHNQSFIKDLIKCVNYFATFDPDPRTNEDLYTVRIHQKSLRELVNSKYYEALSFD